MSSINPDYDADADRGLNVSDGVERELEEAPPSQVLVYYVLVNDGPLAVVDLRDYLSVAEGTIRTAVKKLETRGIVETKPDPTYPKRSLYVAQE